MTCELAKQLKDAGFPQRVGINTMVWDGGYEAWRVASDIEGGIDLEQVLVQPTLSELIEACGLRFGSLQRHIAVWSAIEGDRDIRNYFRSDRQPLFTDGKTPEEVVAKLWLALNGSASAASQAANSTD